MLFSGGSSTGDALMNICFPENLIGKRRYKRMRKYEIGKFDFVVKGMNLGRLSSIW
jgi:hypothetical protein